MKTKKEMWKVFFNQLVEPHGDDLILECNLNKMDFNTICQK